MRLLFLYGVNCRKDIWKHIHPYFTGYDVDYVEYPHAVTSKATSVDDITKWVYEKYSCYRYDAVIGHSLGGIIALQLVSKYQMNFKKIIFLDTNLKPANKFYRNHMTQTHTEIYGKEIMKMFDEESIFYRKELLNSIQDDFDFTNLLSNISQKVYAIYGNRGISNYLNRIKDLNLSKKDINRLNIIFVEDSCHMIMIENPSSLANIILDILYQ